MEIRRAEPQLETELCRSATVAGLSTRGPTSSAILITLAQSMLRNSAVASYADQAGFARYGSPFVKTAQAMRAVLCACATMALFRCVRAINAVIHDGVLDGTKRCLRVIDQISARAPCTSRVLRYRSPRLLMPSNVERPPVEC